jgi:hypothetical protein
MVLEDNASTLQLATNKRPTRQTRHIAPKYFWFLSDMDQGLATSVKVESSESKSDIFEASQVCLSQEIIMWLVNDFSLC